MTAKQTTTGWKKYFFKWTGTTGLVAILLFFAVSIFLEYVIVSTSISLGVTDTNMIIWKIGSLAINISPLFNLLPLSVIIVLFASWTYLTKHEIYTPAKIQSQKKGRPLPPPRRRYEKRSFRRLRRFINRINRGLDNFWRGIKERIANTKFAKYLEEHFAGKSVVKSALTIVLSFCLLTMLVYIIAYPQLVPNAGNWLLGGGNSALQGFIMWTIGAANAIGEALSPLGWLGASIENGLGAISLGFRDGVIGLTTPIVKPLIQADLVGKYVFIQNVAAWFAAVASLYYGSRVHRRR